MNTYFVQIVCDFCGEKSSLQPAKTSTRYELDEGWLLISGRDCRKDRDGHHLCPNCIEKISRFGLTYVEEIKPGVHAPKEVRS